MNKTAVLATVTALTVLLFAQPVRACSAIDAWEAWWAAADTNRDGTLDRREWQRAAKNPDTANFVITFRFGRAAFRRLDDNGDKRLQQNELRALQAQIDYVRHPCTDWAEEQRNRILREHD
ncbi:hypothetical protein [Conchiformibius kuhniae]|uniref:EF-hand domain-containing protein n=1 Tax=Conchiformibius kuhniae TaxID=211502 RepID=A0A8T9MY88_9NEIS|nr:hypothetical protein [Conchiformibius kuhniae]UOP05162.1 hypothetical protein LVJ77_02575 [Conchiformibius kuhniae]